MFEHVDLPGPFEDPLVGALQLTQEPAVVLRLLQVGEGDAGSQVDLVHQRLKSIGSDPSLPLTNHLPCLCNTC